MEIRAYLDNNATSRPHRDVIAAMRVYEEHLFLNAASSAGELLGAALPLERARAAMLSVLGGAPDFDRVILTSGATEANSWVLLRAQLEGGRALIGAAEHSSLLAAQAMREAQGDVVERIPIDQNGIVDWAALEAMLSPEVRLVSLQLANNETGAIQPLGEVASLIRKLAPHALLHSDATQAIGRIAVDLADELGDVDLLSFSAHKFHGPKGIGGLFVREGVRLAPLIPGEQESGLRGGTSNVPGAAGLAAAAELAQHHLGQMPRVAMLRDQLEAELCRLRPDAIIHARDVPRLPNTSAIAFPGIVADDVVETAALQGICIATGSACRAGATAPSHVLSAMDVPGELARATLRFSLSVDTSQVELELTLAALEPLLRA